MTLNFILCVCVCVFYSVTLKLLPWVTLAKTSHSNKVEWAESMVLNSPHAHLHRLFSFDSKVEDES